MYNSLKDGKYSVFPKDSFASVSSVLKLIIIGDNS